MPVHYTLLLEGHASSKYIYRYMLLCDMLVHVTVKFYYRVIACSTSAPPTSATIQVSGHTPHSLSLILSPSANHTLSLACTSDHLSQRTEMTFTWFFRGNPITGSAYTVGVVFQQTGPLLSVTGSGVFGSYQCLATNRGGSAAAVLFVYEGMYV